MDRLVLDASIGLAWVHPGQATPETDALLAGVEGGTIAVVPILWPLEMANALLVLQRRRKLTAFDRKVALKALHDLAFEIDSESIGRAFSELSELADKFALSVYDAAYLELALRLRLPLACKDGPLRQAAKREKVSVLP